MDYLDRPEPWNYLDKLEEIYPEPRFMGKELLRLCEEKTIVPGKDGGLGFLPGHVLPNSSFCNFLESSLPGDWTLARNVTKNDWLLQLEKQWQGYELSSQMAELLKSPGFKAPCAYFPRDFTVKEIGEMAKYGNYLPHDNGRAELLCYLLNNGDALYEKYCGDEIDYNYLLKAAGKHHTKNSTDPGGALIAFLRHIIRQDRNIFKTEAAFPTRAPGVWKKGADILDGDLNAGDDELLPFELWETFHENDKGLEAPAQENTRLSHPELLERFFSKPFFAREARRIASFIVLLEGTASYELKNYAQTWAQKGQGNLAGYEEFTKHVQRSMEADPFVWGEFQLGNGIISFQLPFT